MTTLVRAFHRLIPLANPTSKVERTLTFLLFKSAHHQSSLQLEPVKRSPILLACSPFGKQGRPAVLCSPSPSRSTHCKAASARGACCLDCCHSTSLAGLASLVLVCVIAPILREILHPLIEFPPTRRMRHELKIQFCAQLYWSTPKLYVFQ